MILSGQTKFRTGKIAGVLLLLTVIGALPLAAFVRADDKSDKMSAEEQVRDAILRRVAQIDELRHMGLLLASKQAEVTKLTTDIARIKRRIDELRLKEKEAIRDAALNAAERLSDRLFSRNGN